jgi:hypothetical protein
MIKTRTEREGKLRGRQSFILLLALQGLASLTCDDILYPSHHPPLNHKARPRALPDLSIYLRPFKLLSWVF